MLSCPVLPETHPMIFTDDEIRTRIARLHKINAQLPSIKTTMAILTLTAELQNRANESAAYADLSNHLA